MRPLKRYRNWLHGQSSRIIIFAFVIMDNDADDGDDGDDGSLVVMTRSRESVRGVVRSIVIYKLLCGKRVGNG